MNQLDIERIVHQDPRKTNKESEYSIDLDKLHEMLSDTRRVKADRIRIWPLIASPVPPFSRKEWYILYLKYEQGLSHLQISKIIGHTNMTPRWLCKCATKKLKAYLETNHGYS